MLAARGRTCGILRAGACLGDMLQRGSILHNRGAVHCNSGCTVGLGGHAVIGEPMG